MKDTTAKLKEALGISPDAANSKLSPLWWAELEILSLEASDGLNTSVDLDELQGKMKELRAIFLALTNYITVHVVKVNYIRDKFNAQISQLKVEASKLRQELVTVNTELLHTQANYNKDLRKIRVIILDFGERIRFVPSKLLEKFRREAIEANRSAASSRPGIRAALRKPQLALVLADLSVDAVQLQMISIATSLQEIGYSNSVCGLCYSLLLTRKEEETIWVELFRLSPTLQMPSKSGLSV
ncbi:hypothetical protein AAC387_Pa12g2053 [Persea americana]